MFNKRKLKQPIFHSDFDASKYKGADKSDVKAIYLAIQNGEKLTIDKSGHIYDSTGRWIADGIKREDK